MSRNIDRKELKNPDQFVSFWARVGAAVAARQRTVLAAVVGVLVVAGGAWAVQAYLAQKAVDASEAFARIEKVANAELLPATGEAPSDGLPHFKTEKERVEGALKEAEAFLAANGGSRLRSQVLLLKARYLLGLDRAAEATSAYDEVLAGKLDGRLRFLAQEGLAYAQEAAGQVDKAIATLGVLADEAQKAGGFYRDRALFNKARLLQNKGSAKDAEKLYREILEKSPTTSLREEINDRLATLEGK